MSGNLFTLFSVILFNNTFKDWYINNFLNWRCFVWILINSWVGELRSKQQRHKNILKWLMLGIKLDPAQVNTVILIKHKYLSANNSRSFQYLSVKSAPSLQTWQVKTFPLLSNFHLSFCTGPTYCIIQSHCLHLVSMLWWENIFFFILYFV